MFLVPVSPHSNSHFTPVSSILSFSLSLFPSPCGPSLLHHSTSSLFPFHLPLFFSIPSSFLPFHFFPVFMPIFHPLSILTPPLSPFLFCHSFLRSSPSLPFHHVHALFHPTSPSTPPYLTLSSSPPSTPPHPKLLPTLNSHLTLSFSPPSTPPHHPYLTLSSSPPHTGLW